MCRLSWNLGASNSWNPQGLSRPVMVLLYLYIYIFCDFSRLVWCGVASCWPKNLPMFCSLCIAASRWRRFSLSWAANRAAIPMSMSWTFQTTSHWYVPVHSLLWLDKHLFTLRNEVEMCKSQFHNHNMSVKLTVDSRRLPAGDPDSNCLLQDVRLWL